jgi:hypothetical protein
MITTTDTRPAWAAVLMIMGKWSWEQPHRHDHEHERRDSVPAEHG